MKVSLNKIKQYTAVELPTPAIIEKINQQLGGVEDTVDLGAKYVGATLVRIVSCIDHPNADRLHVCMIDDGGVINDVSRDENGYVQVVCGAPNVHDGLMVVWLPPSSTVPASFDDVEPFVLEARELRGVVSNGMLASAKELALGDNHEGILEISDKDLPVGSEPLAAGQNFAHIFGLDDIIIDIENKMFTHRPDCFGILGVAREVAGISGKAFDDPEWYWKLPNFLDANGLDLNVANEASDKVARLMTAALRGVEIKPSPLWLQIELIRLGSKPINNVVDLTNYVMLLTGQPTHAYDYDKLNGHTLTARLADAGESASLLNGKTYQLTQEDIVIADSEGIIGLGGVMGGTSSEVSATTKNIVLEVATFDMYTIRKTSMRHGIFTDAVSRFNKGQSPLQNDRIMQLLITLITKIAGGEQASRVTDIHTLAAYELQTLSGTLSVTPDFINQRLGMSLSTDEISELLRNVHFACVADESGLQITAPFWRTDIQLAEDIVEEVGRLYGFDKLPQVLPARSIRPVAKNQLTEFKAHLRDALSRLGANELLTYSFVHENILRKSGQNPDLAYRLSNALSPELQYYRLSLIPSLLDKVTLNTKSGYDVCGLFEIGKAHDKTTAPMAQGDIEEHQRLAFVYAADSLTPTSGAPYFSARCYLDAVLAQLRLPPAVYTDYTVTTTDTTQAQLTAPFAVRRSALVTIQDIAIGIVGEFTQDVKRGFKLPVVSAGFEIDIAQLHNLSRHQTRSYRPLSRFPSTERDLCFRVAAETPYQQLQAALESGLATLALKTTLTPIDIYQSAGSTTKNITFRISLTAHDSTLTAEAVATAIGSLTTYVTSQLDAELI